MSQQNEYREDVACKIIAPNELQIQFFMEINSNDLYSEYLSKISKFLNFLWASQTRKDNGVYRIN